MEPTMESVFGDLLNAKVDNEQNLLGNRLLERRTFATLIGPSGIGKSIAAMQGRICAAAGLPLFGITPARALNVLVVQSEDSRNDRIEQVQCARLLVPDTDEHPALVEKLFVFSTTKTDHRGAGLFDALSQLVEDEAEEDKPDLYIINLAFAFFPDDASVENSSDVGKFLRSDLQPFLQEQKAAGIVVHHPPKLTHRDTSKWGNTTWQYSSHGSAEWTNAPRAVIVIEGTGSPTVFEFIVAKRGSKSGWAQNEEGL
jgi:RecA-family ATPase